MAGKLTVEVCVDSVLEEGSGPEVDELEPQRPKVHQQVLVLVSQRFIHAVPGERVNHPQASGGIKDEGYMTIDGVEM